MVFKQRKINESRPVLCFFGCLAVLFLAGCGGKPANDAPAATSGAAPVELEPVKHVAAAQLPKLGDHLPPLDDGRVEIAPPADWEIGGRHVGYLARFFTSGENDLPRIFVTVEDSKFGQLHDASEDNIEELAEFFAAQFKQDNVKLLEPPRGIIIGKRPWVRYVRTGSRKGVVVERQMLTTLAADRLYTIELQVFSGTILQSRDQAYAVAAGMKIGPPAADAGGDNPSAAVQESPVQ